VGRKARAASSLAVALGVAGLGLGACARERARDKPARPVRVETVRTQGAAAGLRYSGTVVPEEQVALAFKVGGYVRQVMERQGPDGRVRPLQPGDAVARGAVLARIDEADYRERVNQAKAQLAEAEAALVRGRADAARAEALHTSRSLTRPELDAAVAARASAEARAEAARAQLAGAEIALRDASLVAPADMVVVSRNVEVASLAAAGTVGFVLADLARVKAVFGVPDTVVERVRKGQVLSLASDALGATLTGTVTAIAPSADAESRVFQVEVTIPNSRRQLKPGMIVSVEVEREDEARIPAGLLTVSVDAIVKSPREGGGFAVFLVEGGRDSGRALSRDVRLGAIAGNRVAVAAGLDAGARVVISGASLLTDGDLVRVIPGQAP
jgi:RND family efflux transporter MFP subunit